MGAKVWSTNRSSLWGVSWPQRGCSCGLFAQEKGASPFHLEPGQQDLCHVPKKLQPHSSIVSQIGQSGAINMLHYSLYSSQMAACVQYMNTNVVSAKFGFKRFAYLLIFYRNLIHLEI